MFLQNACSVCSFFFSFVHFWTLVSDFISQWLAGITISHLESHLDIATRQILSSCYISVSDAFSLTMNSKFLSYTDHCYPASTRIQLPCRLLRAEGPTSAPGRLVTSLYCRVLIPTLQTWDCPPEGALPHLFGASPSACHMSHTNTVPPGNLCVACSTLVGT